MVREFWEVVWIGSSSLVDCFPSLHGVVDFKNKLIKEL